MEFTVRITPPVPGLELVDVLVVTFFFYCSSIRLTISWTVATCMTIGSASITM